MSVDRETNRIVRSWLETGVTALPDRVLDDVLDQLPATRQRRAIFWPARRRLEMNRALAFTLAAAAFVAIVLIGSALFALPGTGVGGPGDEPTPDPTATPMPWPTGYGSDLAPGTYISDGPTPVRSVVTVPAGWLTCGVGRDEFAACSRPEQNAGFAVSLIDNVVVDPCDASRTLLDPPVGESVDDLVTAMSSLAGFTATDPTEVSVSGFSGKQFELRAPTSPACELNENGLGAWSSGDYINGVGPGEVNLVRIIDVDGVRVAITAAYQPYTSAGVVAELRAMLESARIAR